ncbi:HEPN domain-containing protein [Salinibacter ruber]|uniref:HEPN domain-containing protein n=1 Tax=Salinibacter ruber TaxID=146919 RepID=UPI003C6DF6F5
MSEENNDQIRALQEKSEQALSDAELLLENSSVEATVNRGYYAVFQIARAALLTKEESPDTHSGVIRRFGYHFVRTRQVRSVGRGAGCSTGASFSAALCVASRYARTSTCETAHRATLSRRRFGWGT